MTDSNWWNDDSDIDFNAAKQHAEYLVRNWVSSDSASRNLAKAYLWASKQDTTLSKHFPISNDGTFVNNGSIRISDGILTTGITTYDPRKGAE